MSARMIQRRRVRIYAAYRRRGALAAASARAKQKVDSFYQQDESHGGVGGVASID